MEKILTPFKFKGRIFKPGDELSELTETEVSELIKQGLIESVSSKIDVTETLSYKTFCESLDKQIKERTATDNQELETNEGGDPISQAPATPAKGSEE